MNARRVGRELAVLALTQFYAHEDLAGVSLEQILEQALRMLVTETEAELQVAGASLQQAEAAWDDAWEILRAASGRLPADKQDALEEQMTRALSAAQIAINMAGQAFQVPLMRALAETEEVRRFALENLRLYRDHHEEVDRDIDEATKNWTVERLAAVDRNVLRLALVELLYQAAVPIQVAINEAVELAKKYGSEESARFVNGVLGGLVPLVRGRRGEKEPSSGRRAAEEPSGLGE
ncbi:MAG: transcription antitermination factor NusB [Nevskia sp.]|nr:transcription antitermination factor NusB [Nevskia sp.]